MNRSIDAATLGKLSRSQAPSNDRGIASNSAWLIVMIPVTWLMAVVERALHGRDELVWAFSTFLKYLQYSLHS